MNNSENSNGKHLLQFIVENERKHARLQISITSLANEVEKLKVHFKLIVVGGCILMGIFFGVKMHVINFIMSNIFSL